MIDYSDIDPELRGLVKLVNDVSFLSTVEWSCYGHLRNGWKGVKADEGHKFLFSGNMKVFVQSHKKSQDFVSDIHSLESKYPFVFLDYDINAHESGTCIYDIVLDTEDLVVNSVSEDRKECYQVKTEVGERRISEFKEVWDDMENIIVRYS